MFLQLERSVDLRVIQQYLDAHVVLDNFLVALGKKEIIPDLIETCGSPALIKTFVDKLSKLPSAKQKPREICWVKRTVSRTIASYLISTT